MRLICPACRAIASAEAWENEVIIVQFYELREKLPGRVRTLSTHYVGLFRRAASDSSTSSRGLAWHRSYRILSDLVALVDSGSVHWEGGENRPAPPQIWEQALDAVLARRPKALENHNYLRRVAWEMAESLASHQERDRESQRRQSTRQRDAPEEAHPDPRDDAPPEGEERMTKEQWDELKQSLGKIGK